MNQNEDGTLSYGTVIDTSGFDEGAAHIEQKVSEIGEKAEVESARISSLLSNVPQVNIEVTSDTSSLQTIETGLSHLNQVVDENISNIKELEAEEARLNKIYSDTFQKNQKEADAYREQASAIRENIRFRKEIIQNAKQLEFQLEDTKKKILEGKASFSDEGRVIEQTAQSHETLRQKIKNLKEQMADLIANGVDESSEAYRRLSAELGRLTDIQGDIAQQGKVLANDEQQIAGLVQGLGGLSGAFSAAQGAVALFGDENEDLQKIMLKVQSLMAITMGLQQMQQTLNKDSAFQLVTLNGLKEWWNKLLAIGAGVQATETAATSANSAAQGTNAAATAANAAAKEAKAGASSQAAIAEGAETAAVITNDAANKAGTLSNITLAGSFRMVGAAIKSIPVFGWIAAGIGVLIGVISHFRSEAKKANEEFKEHQKMLEDSRKKYAEASVEIDNYSQKIDHFNGNKRQEKKLVEELNSKYGTALGYYDSLSKWKDVLKTKGEAYCQMLMKEAEAQAILSKYTEAYINLLTIRDTKASDFGSWYTTDAGDKERKAKAEKDAEETANSWLQKYKEKMSEAQGLKDAFDMNPHSAPTSTTKGGSTFDPKAAARNYQKAIDEWKEAVKKFNKDAHDEITDYTINAMGEGLSKEINEISRQAYQRKEAWENSIRELAKVQKETEKQKFLSQKGNTLDMWEKSEGGKKTIDQYAADLLKVENISKENATILESIENEKNRRIAEARQRYTDALIEEYGTTEQKMEKMTRDWSAKLAFIPDEFRNEAIRQMEQSFAKLESEDFKASINWEAVFGDMGKQSIQTLEYNLTKIRSFFEQNKESMGTQEIKDYQEAIARLEDEIASRNPIAALHKSLKDLSSAKSEFTTAMQEWKDAQDNLKIAQDEYNAALEHEKEVQAMGADGKPDKETKEYKDAVEATAKALEKKKKAEQTNQNAEQKALNTRNKVTSSFKNCATQIKNVNGVVQDLGGKARNLASVFSKDLADGMDKALDVTDAVLNATSEVIDAIGDTGKSVAKGVETTVEATAQGATGAAAAGASAISTIEKASVILAVISAALQVATAIASLFNDDDAKQEEIENLQRRIDQLQWELDNQDAVRLQNRLGDAVERVRNVYAQTSAEVMRLHEVSKRYGSFWGQMVGHVIYENEMMERSIMKIADAYAKVEYTANKALGREKYMDSRKQLENLAEQQILIYKQIEEERDKKDTDWGKIDDWKRDIQELANEMADLINEMLEEIIGSTAQDLASQLGDAFFEAARKGEDAMEAWHTKVKEIVSDVMQRMLIQKFIEEPLGQIFDRYKKKWFGEDGQFKGVDSVIDSMNGFSNDLNQVGDGFNKIWSTLPDTVKDWFAPEESEREGASKGIATASQDSVDENNARLTTIQGHTYTLVQGVNDLNATSNQILEKVTGIERNTSDMNRKLDDIDKKTKSIKDSVDDINMKGIKLR